MTLNGKGVFYLALILASMIPVMNASAQRSRKVKIKDEIGLVGGVNTVMFYPKDVNRNLINGGDPKIIPGPMVGLSYYHSFNPRLAHIFQVRLADHQIKYWKTSNQTWYVNHERVTVKSDSGDYHLKYRVASMNYLFGWCLNKKTGWHIYSGLQWNYTIRNNSTKTVDRVENGKIVSHEYVPYPEPLYFYDETLKTYSPDTYGEILFRTDLKIKMNDRWTIRPILEFGLDPGHVQVSTKNRFAFSLELYRSI